MVRSSETALGSNGGDPWLSATRSFELISFCLEGMRDMLEEDHL